MRIVQADFLRSITAIEQRKGLAVPEICFVGRSNVGKSSLINSLTLRKIARTGSTPGATRLINLYRIRYESIGQKHEVLFSDFPGFGYSKVARTVYQNWQQMVEGYMIGNGLIRRVLWAFDVRRDFDDLDRMLLSWFRDNNLPFSLIVTKADKEGRGKGLQKKQTLQQIVGDGPVFIYSSKDGSGRKELLAHIGQSLG
jgi:GTP-binding protein